MENFIRGQAWALPPAVGRWAEGSLHPAPRVLTPEQLGAGCNVTPAGGLLEPCCPPAHRPQTQRGAPALPAWACLAPASPWSRGPDCQLLT